MPEDWRLFRVVRNQTRKSLRNDKQNYFKDKLMSGNPSQVWNAAKRIAGKKISGPPTKLYVDGQPECSPANILTLLNINFIKKIDDIRLSFGQNPNR